MTKKLTDKTNGLITSFLEANKPRSYSAKELMEQIPELHFDITLECQQWLKEMESKGILKLSSTGHEIKRYKLKTE